MESGSKSILRIGILFVIGGFVSALGGIMAMVAFFKQPDTGAPVTMVKIIRGVVMPHIFIFLGVGVFVYGIILIAKMVIIAKRQGAR